MHIHLNHEAHRRCAKINDVPDAPAFSVATNTTTWDPHRPEWEPTTDALNVSAAYQSGAQFWMTGTGLTGWLGRGEVLQVMVLLRVGVAEPHSKYSTKALPLPWKPKSMGKTFSVSWALKFWMPVVRSKSVTSQSPELAIHHTFGGGGSGRLTSASSSKSKKSTKDVIFIHGLSVGVCIAEGEKCDLPRGAAPIF